MSRRASPRSPGSLLVLLASALTLGCARTEDGAQTVPAPLVQPTQIIQTVSCSKGDVNCGGSCSTLARDPLNCGKCGYQCGLREVCSFGKCLFQCPDKWTDCGGVCANLKTNPTSCGACGVACAPGMACMNGTCACEAPLQKCGSSCANVMTDPGHCGACGNSCTGGNVCAQGVCQQACNPREVSCSGACVELASNANHCGACGAACTGGRECSGSVCHCPTGSTSCGSTCSDLKSDPLHCGSCANSCKGGQSCVQGICQTLCAPGLAVCGTACADVKQDEAHCGGCFKSCAPGANCNNGTCVVCDSATTDCDGDGWMVAEGDCCDTPGVCGSQPGLINPGALDWPDNGLDDNCNGQIDLADLADTQPCDAALSSNSNLAGDYARALGICQQTAEVPTTKQQATWGLINASLRRADGSALTFQQAKSIRSGYGKSFKPLEGSSLAVISSGIAADAAQVNPGPNQGPINNPSTEHGWGTGVSIQGCTLPFCIEDWFNASNFPLKKSGELPVAPSCGAGNQGSPEVANDSVMLVLRMRAPTNAKSFTFNAAFFSAEYPEFVCTDYNDQLIALVDTPGGPTSPIQNPPDKNLMTYVQSGKAWPIGINIAKGTDLFRVCDSQAAAPGCWDVDVSPSSCSQTSSGLLSTGFDKPTGSGQCTWGGGTGWLETTGNVRPGEIVELRVVIWDVGDQIYDSTALLDGFRWNLSPAQPGTSG